MVCLRFIAYVGFCASDLCLQLLILVGCSIAFVAVFGLCYLVIVLHFFVRLIWLI